MTLPQVFPPLSVVCYCIIFVCTSGHFWLRLLQVQAHVRKGMRDVFRHVPANFRAHESLTQKSFPSKLPTNEIKEWETRSDLLN